MEVAKLLLLLLLVELRLLMLLLRLELLLVLLRRVLLRALPRNRQRRYLHRHGVVALANVKFSVMGGWSRAGGPDTARQHAPPPAAIAARAARNLRAVCVRAVCWVHQLAPRCGLPHHLSRPTCSHVAATRQRSTKASVSSLLQS